MLMELSSYPGKANPSSLCGGSGIGPGSDTPGFSFNDGNVCHAKFVPFCDLVFVVVVVIVVVVVLVLVMLSKLAVVDNVGEDASHFTQSRSLKASDVALPIHFWVV